MSYNVVVQYRPEHGRGYAKSTTCLNADSANACLAEAEKEIDVISIVIYDDDINEEVPVVDGKITVKREPTPAAPTGTRTKM